MYDRTPLRQQDAESVWIPRESIPTYRHVPDLRPPVRRPRGIGLLMFLFCVLLAVYFFATQKPAAWVKPKDAKPAAATAPAALSPGEAEDLVRHLENAVGNLIKTSEEINRSQMWIGRTMSRARSSMPRTSVFQKVWRNGLTLWAKCAQRDSLHCRRRGSGTK